MLRHFLLLLTILGTHNIIVTESQENLAATLTIISEDVVFIRNNTNSEFALPLNAVTPLGIGDVIQSGNNGRALIEVDEQSQILLLPNTTFTVDTLLLDTTNAITFEARLEGIAIHDFSSSKLSYLLTLGTLAVIYEQGITKFGAWARPDENPAVVVQQGEVEITQDETTLVLQDQEGMIASQFESSTSLDELLLHPVQVASRQASCNGEVATDGGAGLRLRAGAALDFSVIGLLDDGDVVSIVGTTENGLWYRIPTLTSYGWIFSSLIEVDCDILPQFENLRAENPERIRDISALELDILQPYYGVPIENFAFYR